MKTILVLDDDQTILDVIKRILDDYGYRTLVASKPSLFFDLLRSEPVDLVLLDIRMPAKDGFQVFQELPGGQRPPVLFVTGDSGSFSMESEAARALWQSAFLEGTTDILYKPFSGAVLYEKVVALIGKAKE
jgi:two-component system response regulator SaeR